MPYPGFGVWLDEKLTCIANQWGGLLALLCDGRVEIDSNFAGDRSRPPGTRCSRTMTRALPRGPHRFAETC